MIASAIGLPIAFRKSAGSPSFPGALPALCLRIACSTSPIVALHSNCKGLTPIKSANVTSLISLKSALIVG